MRRLLVIIMSLVLLLGLTACGQGESSSAAWQEQYDLGMRYLSESDYEEAVIAFNAAIGIDPKQPEAYVGLAEAYIGIGDYDGAAEAITHGQQACGDTEEFNRILGEIAAWREEEESDAQNMEDVAALLDEEDDGTGLNAYGATLFTRRDNYFAFTDMTPEQQQLIETAGNATISNDMNALYGILDTVSTSPFEGESIYTVWNDYKVKFTYLPYYYLDAWDALIGEIYITLRPENGMSYYCNLTFWPFGNDLSDEYRDALRSTCPCVDWQLSGTYDSLREMQQFRDGVTYVFIQSESGQAIDNLRDGTFTRTETRYNNNEQYYSGTNVQVYRGGEMIEADGEVLEERITGCTVVHVDADPGTQDYLDELYW